MKATTKGNSTQARARTRRFLPALEVGSGGAARHERIGAAWVHLQRLIVAGQRASQVACLG
jgi:hypothetical protein